MSHSNKLLAIHKQRKWRYASLTCNSRSYTDSLAGIVQKRNSLLSSGHHLSTTNIKAWNEQCENKDRPQAPSLQSRSLLPTVGACRAWGHAERGGVHHCPGFWKLLRALPLSPEALLHSASFKCPHLSCYSGGERKAVDPAATREGGPSALLPPEKKADCLNGATTAKKNIPTRPQFYH